MVGVTLFARRSHAVRLYSQNSVTALLVVGVAVAFRTGVVRAVLTGRGAPQAGSTLELSSIPRRQVPQRFFV